MCESLAILDDFNVPDTSVRNWILRFVGSRNSSVAPNRQCRFWQKLKQPTPGASPERWFHFGMNDSIVPQSDTASNDRDSR